MRVALFWVVVEKGGGQIAIQNSKGTSYCPIKTFPQYV